MEKVLKPGGISQGHGRLVLGGTGGIGRTQLAIAYTTRHHNDYESVLWLNATSPATLKEDFWSMAEIIFGVQDAEALKDDQLVREVRPWLLDVRNTQWLVTFDNYDDPSQYKSINAIPLLLIAPLLSLRDGRIAWRERRSGFSLWRMLRRALRSYRLDLDELTSNRVCCEERVL